MTGLSFDKMPRWVVALLVVLLLLGVAGELAVTWLLVEHAPWLGWPLTALSVAGVLFAVVHRLRRKRPAVG